MDLSAPITDPIKDDKPMLACAAFAPIYWDNKDTPETIVQAKEHNAVWLRLCAKQPPLEEEPNHEPI